MLNLGCGRRFHPDWTNLDLHPCDPAVKAWNVNLPLPFADQSFDAVYHSHLLEHLRPNEALSFLRECRRVLTPGGIIRIAVPNLETIAQLYLETIHDAWDGDLDAERNHRWLVTELLDQTTRETPGGAIAKQVIEDGDLGTLAWYRLGEDGTILRQSIARHREENPKRDLEFSALFAPSPPALLPRITGGERSQRPTWRDRVRGWIFGSWRERLIRWLLRDEYTLLQIGRFRRSGEIHHWMYDRVSLRDLLQNAGFVNARCVSADESAIGDWTSYRLDMNEDGSIRKPDSLFMEADA